MQKVHCEFIDDVNDPKTRCVIATKDETSRILNSFKTEIENLIEKKVNIIRCDNGTEFNNRVMNELCEEKGGGPKWLFDLDALSKSMNYAPVSASTNSNDFVGKGASFNAASDSYNKDKRGPSQASESDNQKRPNAESSTKTVNTATPTYADSSNDPLTPDMEKARIFDDAYNDRDEGVKDNYNNLETVISVSHIPSTGIHKDHPKEHIIGEVNYAVQTRQMAKETEAGLISFINKQRRTNHKYFQNWMMKGSVKSGSTPMQTHKPLPKDAAGTDVDVYLYSHNFMETKIHVDNECNAPLRKEDVSPQVVFAVKLPILNPDKFDLWKMRIEQYFLMIDYSLWEVILNGDSPVPTRVIEGVVQPVAPTTAE
nr:putative ribonuclease H-like domain-containing protein [Tanacetum cinerariifolium]